MPRVAETLSVKKLDALIKRAGEGPKLITVGGAVGLHLQVRGNTRSWIFRYNAGTLPTGAPRRRDHGLGGYPDVPLVEARKRANALRAQLRDGIDPIEANRSTRTTHSAVLTFDEAARRLIAAKAPEWKNAKHREQWENTLATYASPRIGALPVDKVEQRHVIDVLSPIWNTTNETATRVRSRIEAVLGWATVSGYRTGDNPARWRNHLDKVLPKPRKVRKVAHHAALPADEMHAFMTQLRGVAGTAARAFEFLILTATRSGEVRGATWDEIDLDAATWTIPAERMKMEREHKVPLSPAALRLLKSLPRFAGTNLVFPGPAGRIMSDNTLSVLTRRRGIPAVPHGFRSTFRDWAAERTDYSRDVAEMALAHTIGDKVEAAYRRGDLFAKRTRLMADWAKFIDTPPASGTVTPIRRKA